jgi:hypothetical protein
MGECWLCTYNHTPDAKILAAYIAENSGVMGPAQVAAQVSIDIQKRFPDCEGTDADTCLRHIECHTLHPTCRISSMLRALLRLSDELEQNLRRFDEEGNVTLDPKLIETYLKVQARIMAIYAQSETSRMFGGS